MAEGGGKEKGQAKSGVPGGPAEVRRLIEALRDHGRDQEAVDFIQGLDPEEADYGVMMSLVDALSSLSRQEEARRLLGGLAVHGRWDPKWCLASALTYFRQGDVQGAFLAALRARPPQNPSGVEPETPEELGRLLEICRRAMESRWLEGRPAAPARFWELRLESLEPPFVLEGGGQGEGEGGGGRAEEPPQLGWVEPEAEDAYWEGELVSPFRAFVRQVPEGALAGVSVETGALDRRARPLYLRLHKLSIPNTGSAWEGLFLKSLAARGRSLGLRVVAEASLERCSLGAGGGEAGYQELLSAVSEAVRGLYRASAPEGGPAAARGAAEAALRGARLPAEAASALSALEAWLAASLSGGGALWEAAGERAGRLLSELRAASPALFSDPGALSAVASALAGVLGGYGVGREVAAAAVARSLGAPRRP